MKRSDRTRLARLALLFLLPFALVLPSSCFTEVKAVENPPKIHIIVMACTYDHGYLEANGTVENTGTVPIYSLELALGVWSEDKTTLLATQETYPAGCHLANFQPGCKAAFDFIVSVPGEPAHVTYALHLTDPAIEWDIEYQY